MPLRALLALALLQPPAPPPTPVATAPVDTAAVVQRALKAEQRFLKLWRTEWMDSEVERRPARLGATVLRTRWEEVRRGQPLAPVQRVETLPLSTAWQHRMFALHCHPDDPGATPHPHRIASAESAHGWCPDWLAPVGPQVPDEALALDSALGPRHRAKVAAARRALIATLDSAVGRLPAHPFLVGQRVRFLVDAGAFGPALAATRDCRARAALCARLAGYVLARRGDAWAADSAFAAAHDAMTPEERCAWDDVSRLLDDDGARAYAALSCAARDSANARLWWAARPLLVDAANERRVEHYARRMHIELHAVGGHDERHDWAPSHAGDALGAMYERYGVPSYQFWGGGEVDVNHDGYLRRRASPTSPPYTAAEYRAGRVHVVPTWRAVVDPTRARPDDWELGATNPEFPGTWWPTEHWARAAGPLVPLPAGQTALLRRAQGALLAVATTAPRWRGAPDAREAVLVVSPDPESFLQVARAAPLADDRVVLAGSAGTRPSLVGVEIVGEGAGRAARLRFGVAPPPPLVAMRDGETAVSEPVLFDAPEGPAPPTDPDTVIARMLPTTTVRGARRVGVYWESYGLAPSDTVDVELRVERADSAGALRRLAAGLRLADGTEGGLAIRWREPRPDHVIRLLEAPRPVVARSVVLDFSRLPAGRYWLEVSVGRPGAEPARARREVVLD